MILSAEAASTFILVRVSAAVLASPDVAAAWTAALDARGVSHSNVTVAIAQSLCVRLYLHSAYASVKKQIMAGHLKVAARARVQSAAKAHTKAQKKMLTASGGLVSAGAVTTGQKGSFRKQLQGKTGR